MNEAQPVPHPARLGKWERAGCTGQNLEAGITRPGLLPRYATRGDSVAVLQ
jgi:hypothetical protein